MLQGGDLNEHSDGQLPGGKMREGQDVVLVIQTRPPFSTSSLSQHAGTWPHTVQRRLWMSCQTRSSRLLSLKHLVISEAQCAYD